MKLSRHLQLGGSSGPNYILINLPFSGLTEKKNSEKKKKLSKRNDVGMASLTS